ncbi:MAG: hypothetical protein AAF388_07940, partial [Bacteroidota bacterium]
RVSDEDVFIMTNPDWRGEALAYHICKTFELKLETPRSINLPSANKEELDAALASPQKINLNWMGAYECGRTMDKLLGFRLTPVIWKDLNSDKYLPVSRLATLILQQISKESEGGGNTKEQLLCYLQEKELLTGQEYRIALSQLTKRAYIKQDEDSLSILPKGKRYLSFIRKRVPFLLKPEFHLQIRDHIQAVSEGQESYQEVVYLFYQALRATLKKVSSKKERREHRALNLHLEQES